MPARERIARTMIAEVSDLLINAGLPDFPYINKHFFVFGDMGPHGHKVMGSVTSVGYGPNEGLILYVSAPRYKGMWIKRLERRDDNWVAVSTTGEEKSGFLVF